MESTERIENGTIFYLFLISHRSDILDIDVTNDFVDFTQEA